jgi:2-aminoadipate transaminase
MEGIAEDVEVLDLGNGEPSEESLPCQLVVTAVSDLLQHGEDSSSSSSSSSPSTSSSKVYHGSHPLSYGNDTSYFGEALTKFMVAYCGRSNVSPDHLVPVAGVSGGLDMICRLLCKDERFQYSKRKCMFVEETTYDLGVQIFQDHGFKVYPVLTDDEGIIIDLFRDQLEKLTHDSVTDGHHQELLLSCYIIPTFHNPSGRTMPLSRRTELMTLTSQFGIILIADEVYQWMDYSDPSVVVKGDMPPSFSELAYLYNLPHVITVSSFAKVFSAGMRVGWVEFPSPEWIEKYHALGIVLSGSCVCHFAAMVIARVMTMTEPNPNGAEIPGPNSLFRRHVLQLKTALLTKYAALLKALIGCSEELLNSTKSVGIDIHNNFTWFGGYFIWVKLPFESVLSGSNVSEYDLLKIAEKRFRVAYKVGSKCHVGDWDNDNGSKYSCFARLCFARLSVPELQEAAKRLVLFVQYVLKKYLK